MRPKARHRPLSPASRVYGLRIKAAFGSLISVQRRDVPVERALSAADRTLIRRQLGVELELARLALVGRRGGVVPAEPESGAPACSAPNSMCRPRRLRARWRCSTAWNRDRARAARYQRLPESTARLAGRGRLMRLGIWVLIGLLLGLVGAHFLLPDNGYVLINFRGYLVEMSVPGSIFRRADRRLFCASAPARFMALAAPGRVLLAERRRRAASRKLTRGLMHLVGGEWSKGERLLTQSVRGSDTPLVSYLMAARAAQQQGHRDRRDELAPACARGTAGGTSDRHADPGGAAARGA